MKKFFVVVAFASLSCVTAFASNTCDGGSGPVYIYSGVALVTGQTLAQDVSDSCNINGDVFSNFQVSGGVNAAFPAGMNGFTLEVTANDTGVEFFFNNNALFPAADISLYYEITPGIPGVILGGGTTSGVTEVICDSPFAPPNTTCTGSQLSSPSPFSVAGSTATTVVVQSANVDYITQDIEGGSEDTQDIAPEPMTMSLMGAGLLGLGLLGRRFRK